MCEAIVLCGGAGLRLKRITGDSPKVMACLAGRPFLWFPLKLLFRYGFRDVVLAVGCQQDSSRAHFGERACGVALRYSVEPSPLGTGGGLRKAAELTVGSDVLAMNGDTYTDVDLNGLLRMHSQTKAEVSIVVTPAGGRDDAGCIGIDANWQITQFKEKGCSQEDSLISAGIYVFLRQYRWDLNYPSRNRCYRAGFTMVFTFKHFCTPELVLI